MLEESFCPARSRAASGHQQLRVDEIGSGHRQPIQMKQLQPAQARHPTTAEPIDATKHDPTAKILTRVEAITFSPEAREHLWTVLR